MPDDTGTQYAGLTDAERVLARADAHMPACGEPATCEQYRRRLSRIREHLAVLADAGLLIQPADGDHAPQVWAVVVSNYEPPEVVGLYTNKEAATAHARDNTGDLGLEVIPWTAATEYPSKATGDV